ncbi:unnamed protein product [Soboliphyme baturini]|uniref:Ephrin RBD domain-containing protein n=1 Tax=Soboliphyme baturini TaxID=241478 RepID=A0A183IKW1_9BILA|nr:unnamed protein product [Soboliphyme baturini]
MCVEREELQMLCVSVLLSLHSSRFAAFPDRHMFQDGQTALKFSLNIGDRVNIICPFYNSSDSSGVNSDRSMASVEYSEIYRVSYNIRISITFLCGHLPRR